MAASAPPPLSMPPTAPAIAAQQGGPGALGQFLAQHGQGGGPGGASAAAPLMLAEQRLNEIAVALRDVAKILIMSKPMLMPILQKMIQAGSMLMDEVQKSTGQQQGGGPQQPSGPPEPPQGGGGPDSGAGPTG